VQIFEAVVTAVNAPFVQVSYAYQSGLRDHIARPIFCGVTSGLHWMPSPGDKVALVLIQGGYPLALCGIGHYTDATLATLPALLAGESLLLGPTGNVLKVVQSGAVEAGNPNNPYKAVVLNGDTVNVVVGGVSGSGTVTASSSVLKGN
jgi:hypothetical protein